MNVITIPQRLSKIGELVVIPKKEYQELLILKQKFFVPTKNQKMLCVGLS